MGVRIRERKPGQWWLFINHKGNRVARLAGSYEAAVEAKDFFDKQIALGVYQFPKREGKRRVPILRDYYAKIEATYLRGGVRESTAQRYRQSFVIHILPALGDKGLDEITREDMKLFVAGLVDKKLARCTIHCITACLCAVLNHAVEDRVILQNPAGRLGRFYKQAHTVHENIEPLTEKEVPFFLGAVKRRDERRRARDPECYPVFLCAIHTGMRAGELAGLQWGDIDWNGRFLVVRRTITQGGRVHPTKTNKIRRIDLSDELLAELSAFRRRSLEAALKRGENNLPEWTFTSKEGTPRDMHHLERGEFQKCLEGAKLHQRRFHDLRHTAASLLIQANAPLAYVKDLLGHSSIKITVDIYGHLVPGANREVLNRLPSLNGMGSSATPAQPANGEPVSYGN
jgi:integrase